MRNLLIILFVAILFQTKTIAQVSKTSPLSSIKNLIINQDTVCLPLDSEFKILSSIKWNINKVELKKIASLKSLQFNVPNNCLLDSLKKGGIRSVYAKIVIVNNNDKISKVFLKCKNVTHILRVFRLEDNIIKFYKIAGDRVPYSLRNFPNDPERILLNISPNKSATFFVEVAAYHNQINVSTPTIETYEKGLEQHSKGYNILLREFALQFLFAGFFIAISAFSFLKAFTHQKDKAYLSYAFVNLFYAIGITTYFNIPNFETIQMPWFRNEQQITSIANCLTAISYVFFYRNILNLKVNFKKLYLITQIYLPVNILSLTLQFFGTNPDSIFIAYLLKATDVCYELFSVILTVMIALYLRKNHIGYLKYIYWGCCSLIIGLCIFVPFSLADKEAAKNVIGFSPKIILTTSLIVEVYFFLTALVFRDKIIEFEKNNYQAELALQSESNKIKARFFGVLNHDLRGPVSNLIDFLHIQKDSPDLLDEENRKRIETSTITGVENLLSSMDDILLWSKGQMENFKPQPKNILVDQLFADNKKVFSGYNKIKFEYQNPDNISIFTDENYLKTIVRNLTSNAINVFTSTVNPTIIWKAWQENGISYLSITDNGPGGTEEQFRALYDDKEVIGIKSGLGLHLIRDLAKAINCEISVDSKQGIGTTFILKIK